MAKNVEKIGIEIKLSVEKEIILIEERNQHPEYNNSRSINLFTGQVKYYNIP